MTSIHYGPPRGFPGSPPRLGGRSSSCWCFAGKWLQLPDSPVRLYLFVVCYHQSQVCEVKLIPQFFGELVEGHMPVCNIRVEAGYKSGERCWGLMFPDPESSPASSSPGSVGDVKDGRVGWVAELLPSKPKKIIARVQQVQRMKDMIWYDAYLTKSLSYLSMPQEGLDTMQHTHNSNGRYQFTHVFWLLIPHAHWACYVLHLPRLYLSTATLSPVGGRKCGQSGTLFKLGSVGSTLQA